MSQFITVQGQCGNQVGGAFWPLALHEHGIETTSSGMKFLKIQRDHIKHIDDLSDAFDSFFHVPGNAKHLSFKQISDLVSAKVKARAVLIDMEDSVVSRFKQGPLRKLFDQTCTITNYPGSGNNWAVGYHTHGQAYYDKIEEAIRKTAERCNSLHGFLMLHSLGGGTGSGLGTSTLKLLNDNYPEVDRFVSCVYPAGNQDVVTAPYNVLLATAKLVEHATCVFPADNSALFDICNSELQKRDNRDQHEYNATGQPFQDMNSVIVNMLLHLTSGARFPGSLNTDMNEIATNLVAYPKLHYIYSSVSPISLTASTVSTAHGAKLQDELFSNAWSRKNQLLKIDPLSPNSVIIGSAHIARGNASLTDIRRNIERFQTRAKFTTWSKEATKIGMCSVPPAGHTASLLCLLNSSSMSSMLKDLTIQFDRLYQRKAHVHHYLEIDGFEEADFENSRSEVLSVCERYAELSTQKSSNVSRLKVI
ncbi:tubulin epsilon chain-like isoform X2 [Venturia canescens]|uniref:tubulin epsilon chain-like isoform X2 n=1 Tax=Venturia canescens TaxID=32260 RepID=UPI001C9C1A5C|nr:tubulin epsilon chain-like isoform X2 [Venturia canescens]